MACLLKEIAQSAMICVTEGVLIKGLSLGMVWRIEIDHCWPTLIQNEFGKVNRRDPHLGQFCGDLVDLLAKPFGIPTTVDSSVDLLPTTQRPTSHHPQAAKGQAMQREFIAAPAHDLVRTGWHRWSRQEIGLQP